MPEETSNSRASPISSVRWKMLLIFGVAILLLALIVIIVSYLLTIQAIDNKLDNMVEEGNKNNLAPSGGLFPVYPTTIGRLIHEYFIKCVLCCIYINLVCWYFFTKGEKFN